MGVSIDVDLDLSGLQAQIEKIKAQLKTIDDEIEIDLDDIDIVDKTGDGGTGDGGDSDRDRVGLMSRLKRNMEEFNLGEFISSSDNDGILDDVLEGINTSDSRILPGPDGDMPGVDRADSSNKGPRGALDFGFLERARKTGVADFSTSGLRSGYDIEGPKEAIETHREGRGATYRFSQAMDGLSDSFSKARSTFQRVKPSLGKIYALIALLLPLIITTGAELIGLAAAFGGLAAAGGAAVALGFLGGEADTLSGSLADAEQKANDLKRELFQIIEPTADRLEPVSNAAIQETKEGVRDLVGNLNGLEQAGYFVVSAIRPSLNLVGELFQTVFDYAPQLADIFGGFGQMVSDNAPNFLAGLIEYTIKSIPKLKRLVALFWGLANVIFSLAGIASSFVSVFGIFAPLLNFIADVLGNELVKGFGKFFAMVAIGVGAIAAFGSALALVTNPLVAMGSLATWLSGTALAGFVSSIYSAITGIYGMLGPLTAMNALLWSAVAALALLTGGLAVLGAGAIGNFLMPETNVDNPGGGGGGGFGGGPGMGGGPGGSTTINVYGDVDNATQEDIRTKVGRANSEFGKMEGDL